MGAIVPWGWAILNPRGITGKMYVKHHIALLHTKYTSFGHALGLAFQRFFLVFYCKPMADNDIPGVWPVWTPRGLLNITTHKI